MNVIILTWIIGTIIALIPLEFTVAFLNILAISAAGLMSLYILCILCILARLCNRDFGPSPYGNLSHPPSFYSGHTPGNVLNVVAIMFLTCFLVAACSPSAPSPTPDAMAWASAAPGGTVIIALVAYVFRGRKSLGPDVKRVFDELETTTVPVQEKKL